MPIFEASRCTSITAAKVKYIQTGYFIRTFNFLFMFDIWLKHENRNIYSVNEIYKAI